MYVFWKWFLTTVYGKTFEGENFCCFSLNGESLPMNYGYVDWQYKSTSMLAQNFSNK